jgi:hypothetical protein
MARPLAEQDHRRPSSRRSSHHPSTIRPCDPARCGHHARQAASRGPASSNRAIVRVAVATRVDWMAGGSPYCCNSRSEAAITVACLRRTRLGNPVQRWAPVPARGSLRSQGRGAGQGFSRPPFVNHPGRALVRDVGVASGAPTAVCEGAWKGLRRLAPAAPARHSAPAEDQATAPQASVPSSGIRAGEWRRPQHRRDHPADPHPGARALRGLARCMKPSAAAFALDAPLVSFALVPR